MSDMMGKPPTQFVAYPRGPNFGPHGTVEKMEALGKGYFGMMPVFVMNVIFVLGVLAVWTVENVNAASTHVPLTGIAPLVIVVIVAIGGLSFKYNEQIVSGVGWPKSVAIVASIAMGITCWFFFGFFGYVIMQAIAARELRLYRVRMTWTGIRKKDYIDASSARKSFTVQTMPDYVGMDPPSSVSVGEHQVLK